MGKMLRNVKSVATHPAKAKGWRICVKLVELGKIYGLRL
jgi:hypothetical protein